MTFVIAADHDLSVIKSRHLPIFKMYGSCVEGGTASSSLSGEPGERSKPAARHQREGERKRETAGVQGALMTTTWALGHFVNPSARESFFPRQFAGLHPQAGCCK
jgi:hypothetical protein